MGVAEAVYNPELGLMWALMPVQYSVSFVIGESHKGGNAAFIVVAKCRYGWF